MVDQGFVWLGDFVSGTSDTALLSSETAPVDLIQVHAEALIAEFRDQRPQLAGDARTAFALLGRIPITVKWNQGLSNGLEALILEAVHQAERFGDRQGPRKRRFAIELVVRAIENYNYAALPFPPNLERTFVAPFLGILIDWSVEVLNLHDLWPPVQHVRFPSIFQGAYGISLKIAWWIAAAGIRLKRGLFFASKYERELRRALQALQPEIRAVLSVLPPENLHTVVDELASIMAQLGKATAPFLHLADGALRLGNEIIELSSEQRSEVAFRMLRGLLSEAYANDDFALAFFDSPLGDFLLRGIVHQTAWVLTRNGLLSG